jgi:hypothetical protein
MAEQHLPPDRATLEEDMRLPSFVAGVEEHRWSVLGYAFPHVYVRVVGCDPESGTTETWDFHLTCDNYPEVGPFVERWAHEKGARPPAPDKGSPAFRDALKDWDERGVHGGIYRAWQRGAAAHNGWASMRPDEAWHRGRKIAYIMEHLYALVADQAYCLAS